MPKGTQSPKEVFAGRLSDQSADKLEADRLEVN